MIDGNVSFSDVFFSAAVFCALAMLLVAAVVSDLRSHRIPNIILAPALSLALLLQTMHGGVDGLIMAIGGLALGLVMFLPIYFIGGMAAGDIKLLGVVGCFLGPWGAVLAGLATVMIGAIFGIIAIAWRFVGPVLELHPARSQERLSSMPYAPAIAAGTLTALWYIGFLPQQVPG